MAMENALAKVLGGYRTEAGAVVAALRDEGYYVAPLTTEAGPTARTTDPRTSHQWNGEKMRPGTQAHRLLQTFGRWPDDGLTDEQAMEKSDGVSPLSEYAKRCSDLRSAGLIRDTGRDRKGGSGLDRIVSEITEKGKAVLARLDG
jgi:hypothetical protein